MAYGRYRLRRRRFVRRRRYRRRYMKKRFIRRRVRFTGRPKRWRLVRKNHALGRSIVKPSFAGEFLSRRGGWSAAAGLAAAYAANYGMHYLSNKAHAIMRQRMPWLQGYYYPPRATDLNLPVHGPLNRPYPTRYTGGLAGPPVRNELRRSVPSFRYSRFFSNGRKRLFDNVANVVVKEA